MFVASLVLTVVIRRLQVTLREGFVEAWRPRFVPLSILLAAAVGVNDRAANGHLLRVYGILVHRVVWGRETLEYDGLVGAEANQQGFTIAGYDFSGNLLDYKIVEGLNVVVVG